MPTLDEAMAAHQTLTDYLNANELLSDANAALTSQLDAVDAERAVAQANADALQAKNDRIASDFQEVLASLTFEREQHLRYNKFKSKVQQQYVPAELLADIKKKCTAEAKAELQTWRAEEKAKANKRSDREASCQRAHDALVSKIRKRHKYACTGKASAAAAAAAQAAAEEQAAAEKQAAAEAEAVVWARKPAKAKRPVGDVDAGAAGASKAAKAPKAKPATGKAKAPADKPADKPAEPKSAYKIFMASKKAQDGFVAAKALAAQKKEKFASNAYYGMAWKALSNDEKKPYFDLADELAVSQGLPPPSSKKTQPKRTKNALAASASASTKPSSKLPNDDDDDDDDDDSDDGFVDANANAAKAGARNGGGDDGGSDSDSEAEAMAAVDGDQPEADQANGGGNDTDVDDDDKAANDDHAAAAAAEADPDQPDADADQPDADADQPDADADADPDDFPAEGSDDNEGNDSEPGSPLPVPEEDSDDEDTGIGK